MEDSNSVNYFHYYTDISRITVCVGQLSIPKATYYNSITEVEGFLANNTLRKVLFQTTVTVTHVGVR